MNDELEKYLANAIEEVEGITSLKDIKQLAIFVMKELTENTIRNNKIWKTTAEQLEWSTKFIRLFLRFILIEKKIDKEELRIYLAESINIDDMMGETFEEISKDVKSLFDFIRNETEGE